MKTYCYLSVSMDNELREQIEKLVPKGQLSKLVRELLKKEIEKLKGKK